MNFIRALLDSLVCKDQTPQLDIKDNEIERLRETLKDQKDKYNYLLVIFVLVLFWAFGATLAAIEIGMHS